MIAAPSGIDGGHDDGVHHHEQTGRTPGHLGDSAGVQDAVLTLQPGDDAPALARSFVAGHRDHLPDALIEDAQLLVSEVVTNAVQHGRTAVVLRVRSSPPGIGIAVADGGAAMARNVIDRPHQPPPDATSGRGMAIVDAVASAWGVIDTEPPPGKTVWFELHVTTESD